MVVEPNHQEWLKLMKGEIDPGKLCLDHKLNERKCCVCWGLTSYIRYFSFHHFCLFIHFFRKCTYKKTMVEKCCCSEHFQGDISSLTSLLFVLPLLLWYEQTYPSDASFKVFSTPSDDVGLMISFSCVFRSWWIPTRRSMVLTRLIACLSFTEACICMLWRMLLMYGKFVIEASYF